MNAIANYRGSLFGDDAKEYQIRVGMTVMDWLRESGYWEKMHECPMVVILNGVELMEADYGTEIKAGDVVEIQQFPRAAAVVKFIYWVYVVLMIASAIYILTMPEPGLPETADIKEGSPTYSVSARGNRYRPDTKGPILYGTLRIVPDFDQPAFSTYDANNDQTLHLIFRITQGIADVNVPSITFEDTPLSNFQGVQIEVIPPGEVPTIFPSGVIESNDISNIELLDAITSAYVVNDVGTKVTKIAVDVTSPGLAVQSRSTGELSVKVVEFNVQAQKITDTNAPDGGWFSLGIGSLSGSSRDAIRRTFEYAVDPGRYQVRLQRLTRKDDSQYVQDNVTWAGLKGYLHDPEDSSPNTRLAIAIRASEQIGNRALTDMSVVCSRHLHKWNPVDGWDQELSLTNSIAWAIADLCRANYAGNRSDLNYDLQRLYQLAQQLDPLGHEFNAYFDTEGVTVWDAIVKAGTPGRITPIDKGGFYTFVRDELQTVAVQAFTMRNIIRGSFRIEHATVLEETADSVIVKIQDEDNDFRVREIPCALPDSASLNPRTIELFGVTNPTRAKELGMFIAATNRYRRKQVFFDTGIEGRIPFYGSRIAISHWLIGAEGVRQVSGDIVDFDGVDVLRLSERIKPGYFTNPRIIMIDLDGRPLPAYEVELIDENSLRVIGNTYWEHVRFESNYKRPMFVLGDGADHVTYAKVTKIERDGANLKIEGFVDDPRPYIFGEDVIPPDAITIPGPQSAAPVLSELQAHLIGSIEQPIVVLTWSLKNADKTDLQFSLDGGANFHPIDTGYVYQNRYEHRPEPGVIVYRLAAVNLFRGPWVTVTVDTRDVSFVPPPSPYDLVLRESFIGPVLKVKWKSDSYRHRIEIVVLGATLYTEIVEGLSWDFAGERAQEVGIGRAFTVRIFAIGLNGKLSVGSAQLAVNNPAPPILSNLAVESFFGMASVTFTFPVTVADLVGISVWKSPASGFVPSQTNLVVDRTMNPVIGVPLDEAETAYIRIAAVDAWGFQGLNYSGEYTVTGKGIDLGPIYDALAELQDELAGVDADLDLVAAALAQAKNDLNQAKTELNAAKGDIDQLEGKFPIKTVDITNDAITAPKIAANSIDADKIVANSIITPKLAALAITAEKIAALAITAEKIAAGAITADKIAANAITADKIAANSISGDKIVANAVTADKIAALAVTAGKIAASSVTADKLSVSDLSAISASLGTIIAGLLKTTSSSTDARLEIDSNGSFPLWAGAGIKDATNGQFFYDKTSQTLVIREPATGRRFEFQPSSSMPFWYGSGTKAVSNAWMYFDANSQRLVLRNIQATNGFVTELQSNNWVNNSLGWKLFSDGSAQFNNLVISRPNVVAQGTLSLPAATAVTAHFGNFRSGASGAQTTYFASRYNAPEYSQNVDGYWYESFPAGAGFGRGGYYEFTVNVPTSTFNPEEVGVVNGRMLTAQAVVVDSEYWYSGGAPSYGYETPCNAIVSRVANYGASGSYIQIRIQVPVPFNRHPNINAIQIRSIKWALSAFT
ncbi:host specificity factor TipJ family phage tail protein [Cellvibrio mixtus]|uniref:host specificity factor TipJ family phage tail protein n=1 Tax=Cellvibrio mixtus TaxID=39650 RepID=UPI0006937141|nr:host specificity factor TipJ family phage tail protein [Cellvibrio mixtus]